jgi:hypothetical protein
MRPERAPPKTVRTRAHHLMISRPFRANRLMGWFPGLKSWAELYSPFGATNHPKQSFTSRHLALGFNPGLSFRSLRTKDELKRSTLHPGFRQILNFGG